MKLNFAYAQLCGADVKPLASLPNTEELNLSDTRVINACLQFLASTALKQVNVRGTRLTLRIVKDC